MMKKEAIDRDADLLSFTITCPLDLRSITTTALKRSHPSWGIEPDQLHDLLSRRSTRRRGNRRSYRGSIRNLYLRPRLKRSGKAPRYHRGDPPLLLPGTG